MKKLNILDGSGYIFRAYYALPQLTDKEGRNVNAIY
jgi:5'-3' exonuclease